MLIYFIVGAAGNIVGAGSIVGAGGNIVGVGKYRRGGIMGPRLMLSEWYLVRNNIEKLA